MARVGDLQSQATTNLVGRDSELAALQAALTNGPPVAFVHGVAGIGKSALLRAFTDAARADGRTVILLDCRAIEPTPTGLLRAIGDGIGLVDPAVNGVADRLASLGESVLVVLDNYEVFRVLDSWLRRSFVPALDERIRVVMAGREPPNWGWTATPEWSGLVRTISLHPLADRDALDLLTSQGVNSSVGVRINRIARGHPLALTLAAATARGRPDLDVGDAALQATERFTRIFLDDIPDAATRDALFAASVLRRITQPLLRAIEPSCAPADWYARLQALPFVDVARDGLTLHDAVRESVAASLRAADPARHRTYRQRAWAYLRGATKQAAAAELWRYTADMLHLVEQPAVREAFFPSGAQTMTVEPARPDHGAAIEAITRGVEGADAAVHLERWWRECPQAFAAISDREGRTVGYYIAFNPATVEPELLALDPITNAWRDHLRQHPVPPDQFALFMRRWLVEDSGEAPSPAQGAAWLDIKRSYMEMRPHLRRVYITVKDPAPYAAVATDLGFVALPEHEVELDGDMFTSLVLDMGADSVDGWLSGLVAGELNLVVAIVDRNARELVLDEERVSLTRKEFEVLCYLEDRTGQVVTHGQLVTDVWGYEYDGGSNVDATVVRGLRAKLADRRDVIQTVHGVGYRFVPLESTVLS